MIKIKHYAMVAILAGALAAPASGAYAAGEKHTGAHTSTNVNASAEAVTPTVFKSLDTDKSGTLTQAEFGKLETSVEFSEVDSNGDGTLALAEVQVQKSAE